MPDSAPPAVALLPRERRQRILALLEEQGAVRVAALAHQFGVAEETIRRDLERLGAAGRVLRTHGGALSIRSDRQDQPIDVRITAHAAEKRQIALRAAELVEEGDVVALDASSTALELARVMPDIPLTVVTNGLDAARALAGRRHVRVTLTGGELEEASMCLLGPVAEATLRGFAVHKAMLSCKAIDPARGLSEANVVHASFKRQMVELSERCCLLADHSKFGVRSVAFFGMLTDMDTLITDAGTDPDFLRPLPGAGVETLVAPPPQPAPSEATK